MKYTVYKLEFLTGVHFGAGMLNDTAYTLHADTIFSALYQEAMKMGYEKELYEKMKKGDICISDAFPYMGNTYFLPKPMIYVETEQRGDSIIKKKYKKLKYIQADKISEYLQGNYQIDDDPINNLGYEQQQTMAAVRRMDETLPYHIGTWYFEKGNGIYMIVGYEQEEDLYFLGDIIDSLSYTGIGGKRTSGLGKFTSKIAKDVDGFLKRITISGKKEGIYMLLGTALPKENELEAALKGATYLLEKRSGFVASTTYAGEERRKKDMYVFSAGSCFAHLFEGDIYDVSDGGKHEVYRYAKPIFMEVSV